MAKPLTLLRQRSHENWLIHDNAQELLELAEHRYQDLQRYQTPTIVLSESNPIQVIAGLIAACSLPCRIFLCNPNWVRSEWQQVFELVQPDVIWGTVPTECLPTDSLAASTGYSPEIPITNELSISDPLPSIPLIMIPTGGTSGKIRFAMHTWETLTASVEGFRAYFADGSSEHRETNLINSFCVLPLYHVSGLMQFLRSFLSNGKLIIYPWKLLESGQHLDAEGFFLSLVPTQLDRLLPSSASWLSQFRAVLLGGAPAWDSLLEKARSLRLPIAPTYGMTETASQVVTLKPSDFLNGQSGCGKALPHAQISILNGRVAIRSTSLMLGYYPHSNQQSSSQRAIYEPGDLGYFDPQQFLHIIGRESNTIITGGENVFPAEVEAAIRSTGLVQDVAVLGISDCSLRFGRDRRWGQVVTAVYVPQPGLFSGVIPDAIKQALDGALSRYKHPKHWIAVKQLPRNSQGKVDQKHLQHLIVEALNSSATLATASTECVPYDRSVPQ
jgi:O-succinylbenzoic acid--CoA ligase